jgi:TonB family protein
MIVLSLVLHSAFFKAATSYEPKMTQVAVPVKIRVAEPEVIPPKPVEPKKKKPPKVTPNEVRKDAVPDAPPIQGLTKDSVSDKGTMSAPVGNTTMLEDTGQRMKPDDVKPLQGDMSEPASLIRTSVQIPPYTEQALDASLEGTWIVDVYLDINGNVTSAELRKKIGYGMDDRVIAAAQVAKFKPRKNRLGTIEAGWAEIKFTLVIP